MLFKVNYCVVFTTLLWFNFESGLDIGVFVLIYFTYI